MRPFYTIYGITVVVYGLKVYGLRKEKVLNLMLTILYAQHLFYFTYLSLVD